MTKIPCRVFEPVGCGYLVLEWEGGGWNSDDVTWVSGIIGHSSCIPVPAAACMIHVYYAWPPVRIYAGR